MYFKILAGFNKDQVLNEKQQKRVEEVKFNLVKEFIFESDSKLLEIGNFCELRKEGELTVYQYRQNKKTRTNLDIYKDYYVSDVEFGSGLRKGEEDRKFNHVWKMFIMEKLANNDEEYAVEYFNKWNEEYSKFYGEVKRDRLNKDSHEIALNAGSFIVEEFTKQNLDELNNGI